MGIRRRANRNDALEKETPMTRSVAAVWAVDPPDLPRRIQELLTPRGRAAAPCPLGRVFFRADDIGVPGQTFTRLLGLFQRHRLPLNLAVVPTWLNKTRWAAIRRVCADTPGLWTWHQHGWRHLNHEPIGKKSEFGPSRAWQALRGDLERGRDRLDTLLGPEFTPAFTPPWNRCDERTLALLALLGYRAVSRCAASSPQVVSGLASQDIHIDLHTRRETTPTQGWEALAREFAAGLASPACGIMLHHQRMNSAAFQFLDELLRQLAAHPRLRVVSMEDLAP